MCLFCWLALDYIRMDRCQNCSQQGALKSDVWHTGSCLSTKILLPKRLFRCRKQWQSRS